MGCEGGGGSCAEPWNSTILEATAGTVDGQYYEIHVWGTVAIHSSSLACSREQAVMVVVIS